MARRAHLTCGGCALGVQAEPRGPAAKRIKPLRLPGPAPWRGAIHAIKKPVTLVRLDVTLGPSGDVGVREKTLATGVPVMMTVP